MSDATASSASFRSEARYQRVCAVCDSKAAYHPHHVVREQNLRGLGIRGRLIWDPDNALRVCVRCHSRHHNTFRKIPTTKLRDENIAYAARVMGVGPAVNYLRRYYDDRERDPRIEALAA